MPKVILRNGVSVNGEILPADQEIIVGEEFINQFKGSGVISKIANEGTDEFSDKNLETKKQKKRDA